MVITKRFATKAAADKFIAVARAEGKAVEGPFKTLVGYVKVTGKPMNEFAVDITE